MQYVGRFVSSVYNTITPNINPATLSGAIDVIVVERQIEIEEEEDDEVDDLAEENAIPRPAAASGFATPSSPKSFVSSATSASAASGNSHNILQSLRSSNGVPTSSSSASSLLTLAGKPRKTRKRIVTEMASTPFHVRFGKMSVLRPAERKVTLHLNSSNEPLPFAMKVGEAGEAFFVFEVDPETADKDGIPADLVTSPVLSATTSPIAQPSNANGGPEARPGVERSSTADVEELDLGEAKTSVAHGTDSAASTTTTGSLLGRSDSSAATTPEDARSETGTARSPSPEQRPPPQQQPDHETLQENKHPDAAQTDEPGNLPVPADSGQSGSGPVAGSGSLLDSVGEAASRAGGAITSVIKGSVGVSAGDKIKPENGSPTGKLDEKDASEGKDRLQQQDEDNPPEHGEADKANETEMERLEREMRDQAEELIQAEREARRLETLYAQGKSPLPPTDGNDAEKEKSANKPDMEEAYPAPFGEGTKENFRASSTIDLDALTKGGNASGTRPVAQAEHYHHLDGMRFDTVSADGKTLSAADTDVRNLKAAIHAKQEEIEALKKKMQGESKRESGSGSEQKNDLNKVPLSQLRDENLTFDMDGYKMTPDGESLAFAEGQRFSNELPLSRRHGGKGRHGHSERLDKSHRHYMRDGRSQASDDIATLPLKHGEEVKMSSLKRGSFDDDALSSASTDSVGELAVPAHAEGDFNASARQFSRDLVRLARLNESVNSTRSAAETELPASSEEIPEEVVTSEDDALPEGVPRNRRASSSSSDRPRPYRARTRRSASRGLGHVQEASLSDSETHFAPPTPRLPSASQHTRAKSGPSRGTFDSLPGGATPPAAFDRDMRAQSPEYDWSWGEMPKRRHDDLRQEPRRGRTTASSDEISALLQQNGPNAGKLSHLPDDSYTFLLYLGADTTYRFELSLCWREGFGQNAEADGYQFEENQLSYERFMDDPDVVNDVRLVVRYNGTLLTWENASTVMATLSLYRQSLPQESHERLDAAAGALSAETGGSRWKRWFRRSTAATEESLGATEHTSAVSPVGVTGIERTMTDTALVTQKAISDDSKAPEPIKAEVPQQQKVYAKTLRLSSDQLKSLNLKKGANTITFSVTSSYSGVATCTARIFLWEASHQIVVSDIDGTITKSDALGHVFTMIGRDWTHLGVAKLYTDIARNGYRIMYLTSRAIGQADTTRDYLRGIRQNNYQLPDGPVIMSPDRLMASLHREVILRKPEVFKMACLRDIARLFGSDPRAQNHPDGKPGEGGMSNPTPFYAGFGNRITDALSYRSVNIPSSRIFTIDTNGEVKMELLEMAGYKSSYIHMSDLVDQMFPPITAREELNPKQREYNDFNYWRPAIEDVELPPDEELLPNPVSPALSARSGRSLRSVRSNTSIRSGGSFRGEKPEPSNSLPPTSPSSPPNAASSGRLSRFGLPSLGLGRRSSAHAVTAEPTPIEEPNRRSREPTPPAGHGPSPPSSYGSSWASSWRRRAASPGATSQASVTATSPLVGPVITADQDSDEEEEQRDSDDDVSSLDEDEEVEHLSEDEADGSGREENVGDGVLDDDDDPLLAGGEIRFEWRG